MCIEITKSVTFIFGQLERLFELKFEFFFAIIVISVQHVHVLSFMGGSRGGAGGLDTPPPHLKNPKLLYVSSEILAWTLLRSNWTPRVQMLLEGGPYGPDKKKFSGPPDGNFWIRA